MRVVADSPAPFEPRKLSPALASRSTPRWNTGQPPPEATSAPVRQPNAVVDSAARATLHRTHLDSKLSRTAARSTRLLDLPTRFNSDCSADETQRIVYDELRRRDEAEPVAE